LILDITMDYIFNDKIMHVTKSAILGIYKRFAPGDFALYSKFLYVSLFFALLQSLITAGNYGHF